MTARKKIVFTLIVFTSIILFLFLLGKGLSAKELSQLITSNSLIGQKAPPFSLMTPEKTKIPLSNYEEKIVILNFWNPNCIECRIEAPLLQQTSLTFKDNDVIFLGIEVPTMRNTLQETLDHIKKYGVGYTILIDKEGITTVDYGIITIPLTLVVDHCGYITYQTIGRIDEQKLTNHIKSLLDMKQTFKCDEIYTKL
tara:strand:+ start:6704 stop:7294 length:591 start_codon:yes stop_codon:yes gene_type:complete